MFELLIVVLFAWLFIKAIGLSLRLAWGAAKVIGVLLILPALPLLLGGLLFAGGLILLLPLLLVGAACGVLMCNTQD